MQTRCKVSVGAVILFVQVTTGCSDIAYRAETDRSYRYPSPTLQRPEEAQAWWGRKKADVRKLRKNVKFNEGDGGWIYTQYKDRATSTIYEIAHIKGDNGALKVQCAIGGPDNQSLDIFIHHPVLCGDGSVEGRIWKRYWQKTRPISNKEQLKQGAVVQYDWAYKDLNNRGRATRGGCQTYWVGSAQGPESDLGDWLQALLKTEGSGDFRNTAHTEIDPDPLIMRHEKSGKIFDHLGSSHDLEYGYDINIDLRYGKRNLAKVLEACGY